jgi:hypothetical protein
MTRVVEVVLREVREQKYLMEIPDDRELEWIKRYFWDANISSYVDPIDEDYVETDVTRVEGLDSDVVEKMPGHITRKIRYLDADAAAEVDGVFEQLRREAQATTNR